MKIGSISARAGLRGFQDFQDYFEKQNPNFD